MGIKSLEYRMPENTTEEELLELIESNYNGAINENFVVIVDFKTDRVDDAKALKDSYSEQLEIYAMACEKIFEKEVKEKIIYSFALNKEILL